MNAWKQWTSLERIIMIIAVIILAILAAFSSVALSPLVFGQQPDGESITPVPEPPTVTPASTPMPVTIPPLTPFPPISPRTERAYVPIAFSGVPCSGISFYWCSDVP